MEKTKDMGVVFAAKEMGGNGVCVCLKKRETGEGIFDEEDKKMGRVLNLYE